MEHACVCVCLYELTWVKWLCKSPPVECMCEVFFAGVLMRGLLLVRETRSAESGPVA